MDGKIGVLALQGDVSEHIQAFEQVVHDRGLDLPVVEVRLPADMENLIALAIPGGESTTFMRLIDQNGMREKIRNFFRWHICYLCRDGSHCPRGKRRVPVYTPWYR